MQNLIEKVRQWGLDCGIVYAGAVGQDKSKMMETQARYTLKEAAELLDSYANKDIEAVKDAIGGVLITLIVGASSNEGSLKYVKDTIKYRQALEDSRALDISSLCIPWLVGHIGWTAQYIIDALTGASERMAVNQDYSTLIGSVFSAVKVVNKEFDTTLSVKECLECAYNKIKNKKGKVVNGQFIKEE